MLSYGKIDFRSLILDFSVQEKSLAIISPVCIFEVVLLEEQ